MGRLGGWDHRLRIVQVKPLVLMHVPNENLPSILKGAQEGRIAAVEAIKAHPGKADALLPGVADHRQGQVRLAPETPLGLGNPRRLATGRIGGPRLG